MLAFTLIGLSSFVGANTALAYLQGGTWYSSFATFGGIGNFLGMIFYTCGSLFEAVLWVFALFESEYTGFADIFTLTPWFNFWAPIVEWVALFGYGGVMVLYLLSLILDGVWSVGFFTFFISAFWWAGHTVAHMFFVVKATAYVGGSGEIDFEAMPDVLATEFEF